MSNEDMESWIQAIRNAIESALDGSSKPLELSSPKSPTAIKRHPIGDLFSKVNKDRRSVSGSETRELLASLSEKPVPKTNPRILTKLRNADSSNLCCADCGSTIKTEWCSINLAVILCIGTTLPNQLTIECSGIHRGLGSHISKMRSLTLDSTSFTPSVLNMLSSLPNSISNSVWERIPNPNYPKPTSQSSYDERRAYITAKYVHRKFVEGLPAATRFLIQSIENGDLKGILWALANKADPNTCARDLPALIIALLKDDKMANGSKADSNEVQMNFPLSELLLLNGATPIPLGNLSVEASGLSDSAKRFLQEKVDRMVLTGQLSNSQGSPFKPLRGSMSSIQ
jgi:Arf-GAP with SH3 domain, ANK repeat and PH domain-containing protein